MIGLIGLGLAAAVGYSVHNTNKVYNAKRKSNSYTIAKYIEHAIDSGEHNKISCRGNFDKNEVIRIMAEDGYNYFDYAIEIGD